MRVLAADGDPLPRVVDDDYALPRVGAHDVR